MSNSSISKFYKPSKPFTKNMLKIFIVKYKQNKLHYGEEIKLVIETFFDNFTKSEVEWGIFLVATDNLMNISEYIVNKFSKKYNMDSNTIKSIVKSYSSYE